MFPCARRWAAPAARQPRATASSTSRSAAPASAPPRRPNHAAPPSLPAVAPTGPRAGGAQRGWRPAAAAAVVSGQCDAAVAPLRHSAAAAMSLGCRALASAPAQSRHNAPAGGAGAVAVEGAVPRAGGRSRGGERGALSAVSSAAPSRDTPCSRRPPCAALPRRQPGHRSGVPSEAGGPGTALATAADLARGRLARAAAGVRRRGQPPAPSGRQSQWGPLPGAATPAPAPDEQPRLARRPASGDAPAHPPAAVATANRLVHAQLFMGRAANCHGHESGARHLVDSHSPSLRPTPWHLVGCAVPQRQQPRCHRHGCSPTLPQRHPSARSPPRAPTPSHRRYRVQEPAAGLSQCR
mgnify:CR=1 FL=1